MNQGVSRAGWLGTLIRDYLLDDEFNSEDIKDVTLQMQEGESQKMVVFLKDGSRLYINISRSPFIGGF